MQQGRATPTTGAGREAAGKQAGGVEVAAEGYARGAGMTDLDAIRARDADYNDVFEAQASMSKDIAHRLVAWPVADRRALLKAYDELREAAGKVRCGDCETLGFEPYDIGLGGKGCLTCRDLRRLLGEKT